jgi:hypothetical protein
MKSKGNSTVFVAIIGLVGILVGTFGKEGIDYMKGKPPLDMSEANVQQYQNVYVFIRSRPKTDRYKSFGTVETNSLVRAVESANNKRGFGNIMKSVGQSLLNDIPFENRLNEIVIEAKKVKPELQGLIFSDNLTKCEMIKFN